MNRINLDLLERVLNDGLSAAQDRGEINTFTVDVEGDVFFIYEGRTTSVFSTSVEEFCINCLELEHEVQRLEIEVDDLKHAFFLLQDDPPLCPNCHNKRTIHVPKN